MPLLRFTRHYLFPYYLWYIAGAVMLAATNALSVTVPLYLGHAIDALNAGGPDAGDRIAESGLGIAVIGILIIGIRTASRVLFFTPGRLIEAEVKNDLFQHLLKLQPPFLARWPEGALISRVSSDVSFLRTYAGFATLQTINVAMAVSLAATQMLRIAPELLLWAVGPLTVGLLVVQFAIRWMFRMVVETQDRLADLSDHMLSSYRGVATVRSFAAEPAFIRDFEVHNAGYRLASIKYSASRVVVSPVLTLALSCNVGIALYLGGPMVSSGELTVGDLAAFATLQGYLISPLRSMSWMLSVVQQARAAMVRLAYILDHTPERPDLPDPEPAPTGAPAIEFRGLHFAYPALPEDRTDPLSPLGEAQPPVLHDVSFRLEAGQTLGILGPTGSGKTTLLRCLSRLYNPPPGTVFVEGVDLCSIDLDAWRRKLSYVPQKPFLFSESLAGNVLMGQEDDERLARALALTSLEIDVAALPDGADTRVGEAGVMLSGGQRQRTALARGLVKPHTVLALDDVLSAVDNETERELVQSIHGRAERPTTLIVSNRISALVHTDWIIVLEEGCVTAQGTHEQLVARPGYYQETWKRQEQQHDQGEA